MCKLRLVSIVKAVALTGFSALALTVQANNHDHSHDHHVSHHSHEMVDYSAQFAAAMPTTDVTIEQCWLRLLPKHLPSAGYFIIHNNSDDEVELLAAASPSYKHIMLHETIHEDGMAKMQSAGKLIIPAQASLGFVPGGLHAMFEQPTAELTVGETMQIELLFDHHRKLSVECKVNPAKARAYE